MDLPNEIIKFARENNLSLQERMQLMEILQIQDPVENGIESDELNHNNQNKPQEYHPTNITF